MPIEWYEIRTNLEELARFLDNVGCEIDDTANFLEKPWDWEKEYNLMRQHDDWVNYDQEQLDELQDTILQEL